MLQSRLADCFCGHGAGREEHFGEAPKWAREARALLRLRHATPTLIVNDLRYAWRSLWKAPGFTLTAVLALALGIGATTAMFGLVYGFLLRPLPYANPDQLVTLQSRQTKSGSDLGVNFLDFKDWQEQARSFTALAFFNLRWNGNLETGSGQTETLKTTFTTWNLFALLGIEPVLGRGLTSSDDAPNAPRVMLISQRLWRSAFAGDPNVIGRVVRLDGDARTIIGVMPLDFRFPSQSDLWVPMTPFFGQIGGRSWRADQAIARMKPLTTIAQAQAEMRVIAERLAREHAETNRDIGSAVVPLRAPWTGEVRPSLVLLLAACSGILLLGCLNVSQLLLSRATTRSHELAVRAALGASRAQLARQLFVESALLTIIGAAAGVVLAFWMMGAIRFLIPVELPFWIRFDVNGAVLSVTIIISAVAALLAGLLPAWKAMRVDATQALHAGSGRMSGDKAGARTREFLTVAQVTLSLVLLIGATLVLRSLTNLREVDPGFDPQRVLMMIVNPTWNSAESAPTKVDRFARILDRISALPTVEAAAANNSPPFVLQHPWNRFEFTGEGQSAAAQSLNPRSNFQTVSADYFRVLHIPLLRGRLFDARDHLGAPEVCIVSATLAQRLWPGRDPIGRRLRFGGFVPDEPEEWKTVVGVAGDVRHQTLEAKPGDDIYTPALQLAWKQTYYLVRVRQGWGKNPLSLLSSLRREIAAVAPNVGVFDAVALENEVADSLWQPRLRAWLLGFFSGLALLLAASGLYGTVAFGVARRTREIGIRMALGATRHGILRLVVRQGMRAVLCGLVLGVGVAWCLSRALQASLYGVSGSDLTSYGVASLLLVLAATTACWLPARRAARVNPNEALRHE
ncbi:MAG: ABC transporter permease [Chthoniobacterales bacterium]|nr:ABC transporter permease [Chthoniobacterales bacterium]